MISLLAEAIGLELEEAKDLDKKYEKEFNEEFGDAMSYLVGKSLEKKQAFERLKEKGPDIPKSADKNNEIDSVKDIYRKLAKKTHPDVSRDTDDTEFKEIQRAYSENDISALLSAANRHNVTIELTEEDAEILKKRIRNQKKKIQELKGTVRWAWALSNKSSEIRKNVLISMGVNLEEFKKWKENLL